MIRPSLLLDLAIFMQALLTADWPKRLEQHRHSCIRLRQLSDMQGGNEYP